jgi:DNA repair exonuclease SbcCD ATPase subunit
LDARAEERRSQQRASGSSEANERLVQLSSSKLTIERLIETLESDSLEQNDAIQRLEQATTELDNLKSTLSEASVHLNSFDTQTYDQQVQAFQEKIGQLRDKHQPKKKFSFASTKKRDAVQSSVRQVPAVTLSDMSTLTYAPTETSCSRYGAKATSRYDTNWCESVQQAQG